MSSLLAPVLLSRPLIFRLARLLIRPTATQSTESVQEVCTTGYSFMTPSGRVSKYGIFWGPDDPRNIICEVPGITHVAAMLMAMIDAVRMVSQCCFDRDFHSFYGPKMKNAQLLDELYKLSKDTDVIFRYRPAVQDKKPNYVIENILKGGNFKSSSSLSTNNFAVGDEMDTNGEMATTSSNDWPVVYTMAMCKSSKNGFNSASYVTVWSDKRCGQSSMHRLAMMPVTLFRAQLAAIEEALRQAVDNRLPRVVVVTDSQAFLLNWRKGWLKTAGSPVPNKFLYDRIKDLAQSGTKVRFRYEAPQADNSMWSEAIDKCFEAIDLPLVGKDRSEYKRDISEVVADGSLFDSSTAKVRIFKKDMNKPGGIIWEANGGDAEDISIVQGRIHHGLINILEKATSVGFKHIIVRTNSVRLILASENWLPIWHRNGWRNSLHKPIADADSWKKIWWLKKTVKVGLSVSYFMAFSEELH
uniref:ribonuclease H n=1 Tax=Angiostrongylus cantonensis TaxID=6313 RepID=A0A0K0DID1_ANGCA